MKRSSLLLCFFSYLTLCAAEPIIWNSTNKFENISSARNVKYEINSSVLVLTNIMRDSSIEFSNLAIDPVQCNRIRFTYRAEGTGKTPGQIFYARKGQRFSGRNIWRIPRLNADGQWNTITLNAIDALNNRISWNEGGVISRLRFDFTDSPGGKIEIREIKLDFQQNSSEWNAQNNFEGWSFPRRTKVDYSDGNLVLFEIGVDPQLINKSVMLDPKQFNCFSFTYRAEGIQKSAGQLYYAGKDSTFSSKRKWNLIPLIGDGKWHTQILTEEDIVDSKSWTDGDMITSLRFDPVDAAGGKIEIKEMKFFKDHSAKVSLRLPKFSPRLDEPHWPVVKPQLNYNIVKVENEPYFQGKMICSPLDLNKTHKNFYLRREFYLKEKPQQAWLQFTADDSAVAYLNGKKIALANDWHYPVTEEVSPELKAGKNVLGFY